MPNPTPTQQGETLEMPERIWLDVHEFALCCRNSEAGHYFLTPDKESVEYVRAAVAGPREDALFAELLAAFDSTRMGDKGINQGCWCVQSPTDTNQPDWKHEKHCKRNMALLKRCEAAAPADNDAESKGESNA